MLCYVMLRYVMLSYALRRPQEFGDGVMPQKAVKSLIREILEAKQQTYNI